MVSSGVVNSDLSSLKSYLSTYSSEIGNLDSSWKGPSHDNLVSKAEEFLSEYSSTIEGEMSAFATACDLYEQYKTVKSSLEAAQRNYNAAVNNKDSSTASSYSSQVSTYSSKLASLKSQIEANLQSASASTLTADSTDASTVSNRISTVSTSMVQGAIDWAMATANDDSHGYSQQTRWGNPNYDCSSFVISSWEAAGVPVKEAGATYTGDMRNAFLSTGQFEWIPGDPDVSTLQAGDVLLSENSHTEMYIGNGQNIGAHSNYDGVDGDSSGREVSVGNYYSHPWDGVLRYIG